MAWTQSFLGAVTLQGRDAPKAEVTDAGDCSRCGLRPVESGWDNFCRYCGACFVSKEKLLDAMLNHIPEIEG